MQNKIRLVVWAVVALLIVSIFLLRQPTNFGQVEVQQNEAVADAVILLVLGGAYELWQWIKTRTKAYRIAFGVGLLDLLLLGWASGAVGIIGSENNPVNLMYWAVPAVGFLGILITRLKPHGMAYTLFVAAVVQFSIPAIALIISPTVSWGNAGVIGVFGINTVFAAVFATSGLLFQRAAKE